MKKRTLIILVIVAVLLILLPIVFPYILTVYMGVASGVAFGALAIYGTVESWLTPPPPRPEVEYAEFPFEIVYTIDDEEFTVNDIYVCEFEGFKSNETGDKKRDWKGYIKSTGDFNVVLIEDGNLEIRCDIGSPRYYMSDPEYGTEEHTPYIYVNGTIPEKIDEIIEQYNVELVSWNLSEPIENEYK